MYSVRILLSLQPWQQGQKLCKGEKKMNHAKRLVALFLVCAMMCSLTAFAHSASPIQTPRSEGRSFREPAFTLNTTHRYADDDIVRAIVLLDGAPEAERSAGTVSAAADHRLELQAQHKAVQARMPQYQPVCEFTSLLNGFSVDVPYGKLDSIASIPGVSSVHIANTYAAPTQPQPLSVISGIYSGNTAASMAGFDGAGLVVAVLDTGLNTTHEAFQDADGLCAASAALTEADLSKAAAGGAYLSAKIPFAYDYADHDRDVTDHQGHGTHVSGISVGYAADGDAVTFRGAAPAAQLLSMKVFHDDEPGTSSDIFFLALEDAYRLGADVINMSLGAPNGFTYDSSLEAELFGNIYCRLDQAGVILSISAGNAGSMADTASHGFIGADYTDYGTVSSPATFAGNTSIASMESGAYPAYSVTLDGVSYSYTDSSISPADWDGLWLRSFIGRELPFAVVTDAAGQIALGTAADFEDCDVSGKLAVVQRGAISFQEKVSNAADAGAIGLIVCNNQSGSIGMSIQDFAVPAISVDVSMQEAFLNTESTTLTVESLRFELPSPVAFQMSSFSSWGTSPDLTIDPAITSFGGNINSAYIGSDSAYDVLSGTSMSAPFFTGTVANVLTYLEDAGFSGTKAQRASAAEALLESTAVILPDGNSFYAVRRQGAGLADAMKAIETYEHAGYIVDPLKELGHDAAKSGVYAFDVTLRNTTDHAVHYADFASCVLTDALAEQNGMLINRLSSLPLGHDLRCTVNGQTVTAFDVPAGASVTVSVELTLDSEARAYLDQFPNGAYAEGFVTFTADGSYDNHATFLAYYGDWTAAPVVEEADFRDYLDAAYQLTQIPGDEAGHSLAELGVTPLDVLNFYTMPNAAFTYDSSVGQAVYFLGGNLLEDVPYRPEYLSFTTAESMEAFCDGIAIQPFQLRNAKQLSLTVTDAATGEVLYTDQADYWAKAIFSPATGAWDTYGYFTWDGLRNDGTLVPSGTTAHVQLDAVLPYGDTLCEDVWSFDVTVDYTAPYIDSYTDVVLDSEAGTLTVSAADERYLQSIFLMVPQTGDILDARAFAPETAGETCTAVFDIKPLLQAGLTDVDVAAMDYATNMTSGRVSLYEKWNDVTLTLVSPLTGAEEHFATTGMQFTFPDCPDAIDGAVFDSWAVAPAEHLSVEDYASLPRFYPGETVRVTGAATYYALYAVGDELTLDTPTYYLEKDTGDYAGSYALVGLDPQFVVGNPYDTAHPQALGQNAQTVDVASLSDAVIDDTFVQFSTAEPGLKYIFTEVEDPMYYSIYYAIQNAETGKYLAMTEDFKLAMVDEITDYALWDISSHYVTDNAVEITNHENYGEMMLLYNQQTRQLEVMDKYTVVGEDLNGREIYAQQAYKAWLFTAADSEFITDYYTTSPGQVAHVHKWDEGSVTLEPTCTEDGVMTYTCRVCGETYTEAIPAAHSWDEGTVEKIPTCTEEGRAVHTCTVCGETRTVVLPMLPHDWDNGRITLEPSCMTPGIKTYTCAACGKTREVEIPALGGHHYDGGTVTKAPTYTEAGEIVYTCMVCGETLTAVLPPLAPITGPCYCKQFTDCPSDAWYHEAVDYMLHLNLMNGVDADRFAPYGTMTRAMMATVLYRAAGEPAVSGLSSFVDVPADTWYSDAVAWVQENNIVMGVLADRFAPHDLVTREQLATVLWRSAGCPAADADLTGFADAGQVSGYAAVSMKWAVAEGILKGDAEGRLNPRARVTRAEFSAVMLRYLGGSYDCEG